MVFTNKSVCVVLNSLLALRRESERRYDFRENSGENQFFLQLELTIVVIRHLLLISSNNHPVWLCILYTVGIFDG